MNVLPPSQKEPLIADIQHNCNISDAKDHGIYSMCTMVLKLRNLYKWENDIEPWDEADPGDLLDWIEAKENYWETIREEPFRQLGINGHIYSPDESDKINNAFKRDKLLYGAGYGRSLKAVFFLAEKLEQRLVAGCPVILLGKEIAKEMASPFAMAQDGIVYIRKASLRYFLWDQIQELRASCRTSLRHAMSLYGLLKDDQLNHEIFKDKLDSIVEEELDLFVYHEVGELLQTTLDSATSQKIILKFPGSIIELVCRSIKDILADTHPEGLLAYLVREKRETSLSFYVGFLDGLRKKLFPEIIVAWNGFRENHDWQYIENARKECRSRHMLLADKIREIAQKIDNESDEHVQHLFDVEVISPLNITS